MKKATDISVLVSSHLPGVARTVRMALRGMGVRTIGLAVNNEQLHEGFKAAEPDCLVVYVDGPTPDDPGLETLLYVRRSAESPHPRIPIVALSPRRDLVTINAVIDGGAHEYVLFPASGEVLLKKITAARTTTRPWIERSDYCGPQRRVDRDTDSGSDQQGAPAGAPEPAGQE
jgi:DNA-binding NarL/FixJ family response regulator